LSTFAYAVVSQQREEHKQQPIDGGRPVGPLSGYTEAMAGLVPAEVLALHAVVLSFTTETDAGTNTTIITRPELLTVAFWGLFALSIGLFLLAKGRHLVKKDWGRACVPPAAFIAWTMLQRSTAFDAVSDMDTATRNVVAAFTAVVLVALAGALSMQRR
jgi:hypothetical protein